MSQQPYYPHSPHHQQNSSYHRSQQDYRPFHYPSTSTASAHSHPPSAPVSPLLTSETFARPSTAGSNPAYSNAYGVDPYVSPIMSRTPSVAGSDRYSTVSGVTGYWPQNPDNVKPDAAYVAPFGAVQVVNEHCANTRRTDSDDETEDERDEPANDEAQFSPQALALINSFLDQLLYSFLSTARSTNLHALRPAVTEVLRQRLAKEAVANADEELHELLAGGEEEDEKNAQAAAKDNRKWDLELVWKRTRLRVMVYMRLGEMEDDDEEKFVKEQELFYGRETDNRRFSTSSGLVSWAAAIFLTSVLEYVAEQSLQAAGSVAYARARRQSRAQTQPGSAPASPRQFTVEDFDVEKVALDARLGRLWRTWRKTLRNDRRPSTPGRRGMSSRSSFTRDRGVSLSHLRNPSMGHHRDDSLAEEEEYRAMRQSNLSREDDDIMAQYPEYILAANIPLPMRDAKRDVDEIEVPGLANVFEEDDTEGGQVRNARRNSFTSALPFNAAGGFGNKSSARSGAPVFPTSRPTMTRKRSKSVPNPPRTPILDMPGAFPEMPEEIPAQYAAPVEEVLPEPKASAQDMQAHKQDKDQSKVLLDDKANVPRQVDDAHVQPSQGVGGDKDDEKSTGLVMGAVAGAGAAVAAAAVAATGYAQHEKQDEGKILREQPIPTDAETTKVADVNLPRPRERSAKEIEELDKRKSRVDMKSIMISDGPNKSSDSGFPLPPSKSDMAAASVAPGSSTSLESDKSNIPAHREHVQPKQRVIPVADQERTAEAPPSPKALNEKRHMRHDTETMAALEAPASPSEIMENEQPETEQKARDMPMIGLPKTKEKPGRLLINGDVPDQDKDYAASEALTQTPPRSPREFLRDNDDSQPQQQPQQPALVVNTRQSPSEQTRASAPRPGSAVASPLTPTVSQQDHQREYMMAKLTKENRERTRSTYSSHSRGDVQDHPALSNKGTPKKDVAVPVTESGTHTPPIVTSASIRGPEDFDHFLQGGDTVKYTLTPETVRDDPSRPPTGEGKYVPKKPSDSASVSRMSGQASEGATPNSRKNSSSAVSAHRSSRHGQAQSIKEVERVPSRPDSEVIRERRMSSNKPSPKNTSALRRSGLTAREPQVLTASTRDFADFIRSTGPDREPESHRLNTSRSAASLHSMRNTGRSQSVTSSVNAERTKSLTHTTMAAENIPPVPRMPAGESKKPRMQLQARDATGAGSGNKDLINFIRDGPEEQGSHRIPRTVAPFRNTMDSDRFEDMGDVLASGGGQTAKVNGARNTPAAAASRPTPASRTTSSDQPIANNIPAKTKPAEPEGDGRKRYRNKDPYAIPSDSEDEEEADFITALPGKNQRPQEESLVDFLRDNEPPSNNSPRPISAAIKPSSTPTTRTQPPPTSTNTTADSRPTSTGTGASGPRLEARGAAPRQRIPRGNAGARLGAFEETNTGDLADFLRSSGPSEASKQAAPAPVLGRREPESPVKQKKKSFFSRLAGRREKV
ncbi:hypothetical protein Q7P37_009450 [Cladosporium fusiforme]